MDDPCATITTQEVAELVRADPAVTAPCTALRQVGVLTVGSAMTDGPWLNWAINVSPTEDYNRGAESSVSGAQRSLAGLHCTVGRDANNEPIYACPNPDHDNVVWATLNPRQSLPGDTTERLTALGDALMPRFFSQDW